MNQLRLTSLMMVVAAATWGLSTGCSSSSSKGGSGGTGVAGSNGIGGKTGTAGTTGTAGAAGGTTGGGGAAGGTTGGGGAAGGTTGLGGSAGGATGLGGAAGGATGSGGAAGGTTGTAGAAGGSAGMGGAGGAPVTTLLVDHDDSANNQTPPDPSAPLSASDTFFAARLTAEHILFATTVIPDDPNPTTPHFNDLAPYSTVLWYTGGAYGKTMTASQQTTLKNWLDAGGKTLLLFSQNLFYDLGGGTGDHWTTVNNNTFLTDYIGAAGWYADAVQFVNGQDADLNHNTYTVAGAAGTAFAGMNFTVVADTPVDSTADVVNPATATALATIPADVQATNANTIVPIALVRTGVGTAGTSKILFVGLTVEDIQGAPTNTGAEFVHAALKTVGLVQ